MRSLAVGRRLAVSNLFSRMAVSRGARVFIDASCQAYRPPVSETIPLRQWLENWVRAALNFQDYCELSCKSG
jgi:hypothetical protein